jgi:CheY-like chemotaxis protein
MEQHRIPLDEDLSPEGWRERVHACFEALRLQQIPLSVETSDGVQMEGHIESLDTTKGRMVLSILRAPSAGLRADDEVRLLFSMHESRWVGRARVHYHNDRRTRFTLILPLRLDPSDRRREMRVLLDTAENIKARFRPSGAEYVEVTGRLSNLSEGGFRLAVESALDARRGRPIDPSDVPLEEDQLLESLSITGLREHPVEAEGIVLEVDPQPLGPILGIRFRALPRPELEFLRAFVVNRVQATHAVIPVPVVVPPPPPAPVEEPPETTPVPASRDSLEDQRVRRFKTLGLVMPPGFTRNELQAFLASRGFTRVMPAGTLLELAGLIRKSPPDAFLVDWPDPSSPELDIVQFLGNHPFPSPPRIILACTNATTQLAKEANRLGVSHLLVKPYALDADLTALVLDQLRGDEA